MRKSLFKMVGWEEEGGRGGGIRGVKTYSMQNPVSMAKLKSAKGHRHPTFNIGWEEDKGTVFYNHF